MVLTCHTQGYFGHLTTNHSVLSGSTAIITSAASGCSPPCSPIGRTDESPVTAGRRLLPSIFFWPSDFSCFCKSHSRKESNPVVFIGSLESMGICFGTNNVDCEPKLDYSAGKVHVITDKGGWEAKIEGASKDGKIVVVNFSASWCEPCRNTAPLYAELSTKYPSLVFLTVDIDLTELSSSWDIQATPTFIFLKEGKKLDQIMGANKLQLEKKLVCFAESSTYYSKPPCPENNVS